MRFQPRLSAGLQQEYVLDNRELDLALGPNPGTEQLDDDNSTSVTFGAGLDVTFAPGMTGSINFDGAYGKDEERYGATAGINIAF